MADTKQKSKEWVYPLWINKLVEGSVQSTARPSISGKVCVRAPSNIAFLPNFLESSASQIQAPETICVSVSIAEYLIMHPAVTFLQVQTGFLPSIPFAPSVFRIASSFAL